MAQIDPLTDALVGEWLSLPDVAGVLGMPVGRVKQLLRDRKLLAVTRPEGTLAVPAAFLAGVAIFFTGEYPEGLFKFMTGVQRYINRGASYAMTLTTDKYPPFSLD